MMKELFPLQILRGSSKAFSVCLQRLPAHEENVPIGLLQAANTVRVICSHLQW
jgi:hypothetical protein